MVTVSVLEPSKESFGNLNSAVYLGEDSLSNINFSKSSKLSKNSSTVLLIGLIRKFSLYVDPLNGLPLTFNAVSYTHLTLPTILLV